MIEFNEEWDLATIEECDMAAREALKRPSDAAFWDRRLYTSHVPTLSWADRSDDILAESNFYTVLEDLQAYDRGLEDVDYVGDMADVFDGSVSHWAVGSLRQIYVRVYLDDESTEYTVAFRRAVHIALKLRDEYPVFDESDYSEREWKAFEKDVEDALAYAQRDYDDDDVHLVTDATQRFFDRISTGDLYPGENGSCDWDEVATLYREAREEVQA